MTDVPRSPASSATILLVDAEVLVRFAIADYLRDCGYRVIEASSGKDALLVIEKSDVKVDIVLCDAALKGKVNGFILAQWIRTHRAGLPVILAGTPAKANHDSLSLKRMELGDGQMMGRLNQDQGQLFYSFNLDEAVPDDHLVRKIAAVLDPSWVHGELAAYYSPLGRPSIDPVLMIRMLIVGYVFAIRSERALCREVQVNLAYRWFCGLSIENKLPDHSAFSRARNERFRNSVIFRQVFERVVGACIAAGLVGGEGFAVDASLIEADANKCRSIPSGEWSNDTGLVVKEAARQRFLPKR